MSANLEYQRIACQTLGLVHPEDRASYKGDKSNLLLELGFFRIIENDVALDAVVLAYLNRVIKKTMDIDRDYHAKRQELAQDAGANIGRETALRAKKRDYDYETAAAAALTYREFMQFNGHGDSELKREPNWEATYGAAKVKTAARRQLATLQLTLGFPSSRAGYREYLQQAVPRLYERLCGDIPALVPEDPRRTHSYVMSTTETGKSELLKALCLNYVQNPNYCGVVVLDPGGDMCRQIASWPELIPSGRLVYIDPALDQKLVPIVNPFDATGLSDRERALLTGQVVAALGTLVEGKLGGTISIPMQAALYPSVRLLIDLPNTSLKDLQAIMRGDERLLRLGTQSPVPAVAEFFQLDYDQVHATTRNSIVSKIGSVLSKGILERVLCGRTSINLKRLLEQNKIVVVNLAKGRLDPEETTAFGTLLISQLQAIAMERVNIIDERKRPMTHAIIDECQNFVTGEIKGIIREARKFGLSLTLAQQEVGAEMPEDLRKAVIKTTNVKIAGRSATDETRKTGDLVGVLPEEIRACEAGEFYCQAGTKPAFKLHVRADRLGNHGCVNAATWRMIVEQQKRFFYRDANAPDPEKKTKKTAKEKDDEPPKPGTKRRFV